MKKYIFFLMGVVCFLLSSLAVHANELNKSDANIIGHVLDKSTKEHLSFISVSLKGTTIGTMTDASGHYFLKNLPEGEFTMEVSAVGYKTVSRKVTLRKGKTLEENFEIEEDLIALDGVVVSANRSDLFHIAALVFRHKARTRGVDAVRALKALARLFEHRLAALGAVVLRRHIPSHEVALLLGIAAGGEFAGIVRVLLVRLLAHAGALHHAPAALGAAARHFDDKGLGERALRVARAGQKAAKTPALDDHVAAADVALLLADLIGDLESHALKRLLGVFKVALKAAVKAADDVLPRGLALFDGIELFLHAGGELHIHNVGKALLHQSRHHLAQRRGAQVLAVLDDVLAV